MAGPDTLDSVSVGDVLFVGAGAVGNVVAYWLRLLGNDSRWAVVDGDLVKLLNTDRSLLFSAAHAGWAGGSPGGHAEMKAKILEAWLPGAVADPCWYDESPELWARSFDVVLALANEPQVRQLLAARLPAVALQATTGERFLAQLHRHILGHDDCIACRTGQLAPPRLGCASERVEQPDGTSADAALPFLSAASGLMLVTALQRLQAGELAKEKRNRWDWRLGVDARAASSGRHRCREGCPNVQGSDVRARVTAGRRWAHLVG
jgi:molybdopterin/thiamine biosynthesis adenylyltransferase